MTLTLSRFTTTICQADDATLCIPWQIPGAIACCIHCTYTSSAARRPISAYDISIAAASSPGQGSRMTANDLSAGTSVFRRVLLIASKARVPKGRRFGKYFFPRRLMLDWNSMTKVTSQYSGSPWQCGMLFFHAKHCVRRKGTETTFLVSYTRRGPQ